MSTLLQPLVWVLSALLAAAQAADVVPIGEFSRGKLDDWEQRSFHGLTDYRLVSREGRSVLFADSQGSASALYRTIRVSLQQTPVLNWSWRLDRPLAGLPERQRSGDDFALRVYVVVSGGAMVWRTRSLVYVWSGTEAPGSHWSNPFTANAHMVVLRSGIAEAGQWVDERRDVRADFARYFGFSPVAIDGVAVMTDSDNSGGTARGWYGDIHFSAR